MDGRVAYDFIQLREKDLECYPISQSLATREVLETIGERSRSKLLVNLPGAELAASGGCGAGADGVHLAGKPTARCSRRGCGRSSARPAVTPSSACPATAWMISTRPGEERSVDLILFSPIFEKLAEATEEPCPRDWKHCGKHVPPHEGMAGALPSAA